MHGKVFCSPTPFCVTGKIFSACFSPGPLSPASPIFAVCPFLVLRGVSRGWRGVRGIWPHGEQVGVLGVAQKTFIPSISGMHQQGWGFPSPHHQCTLAFVASQVCGSGVVGDASHSYIFRGAPAHFPPSFCSDCQENLGPGADPTSPPRSHNAPMDFPFGGLAQANQTNFRSSSLLSLSSAGK